MVRENIPDLEVLVESGIYDMLFAIANFNNHKECQKTLGKTAVILEIRATGNIAQALSVPLKKASAELSKAEIKFKSAFLNEEYKAGNLYRLHNTPYIRIKAY